MCYIQLSPDEIQAPPIAHCVPPPGILARMGGINLHHEVRQQQDTLIDWLIETNKRSLFLLF